MKPRMIVPLSMTLAMFSSPCVNLMWSTLVSMVGNVLSTSLIGTPGANGV